MAIFNPINLLQWVQENKAELKPPVGNKVIQLGKDFFAMAVGGPNARTDYHINQGEELFYQIEGDITLNIKTDNNIETITIKEGELFLLPAGVAHSPQRPANTVGLVIERVRENNMLDTFQWFCPHCSHLLYETSFHVSDIVQQLNATFEKFNQNPKYQLCNQCNKTRDHNAIHDNDGLC